MKKAIITLSLICVGLLSTSQLGDAVFAQDTKKESNKTNVEVQVINKLNKEQAEELLSMYNPNVKYIYIKELKMNSQL